MNVGIYKAGDYKLPSRINESCSGRRFDRAPRANLLDALSLDDDGTVFNGGAAVTAETTVTATTQRNSARLIFHIFRASFLDQDLNSLLSQKRNHH